MLAAAKRAGTVCAMSHEFRFTPSRIAIKELIENRHLGPLREIEIADLRSMLRADVERPNGWWFSKTGGPAQALVSHLIDNANWLAGRAPARVTGFMRTANPQRHYKGETFTTEIGDGVFALLDYGDGLVGRITCDCTVAHSSHLLAVHGEKATAVASGPSIPQTTTFVVDENETSELELRPSPYAKFSAVNVSVPLFMELLDELAKALDGKPAAIPTLEDGLATQRVLEAIGYVA
jgi:predicted dehydrogenase